MIFLASKCGISEFSEKNFNSDFLIKQLDKSLNDLETDFDLIQLHNLRKNLEKFIFYTIIYRGKKKRKNKSLWIVFKQAL